MFLVQKCTKYLYWHEGNMSYISMILYIKTAKMEMYWKILCKMQTFPPNFLVSKFSINREFLQIFWPIARKSGGNIYGGKYKHLINKIYSFNNIVIFFYWICGHVYVTNSEYKKTLKNCNFFQIMHSSSKTGVENC